MPKGKYKNVRAAAAGFARMLDKAGVPNLHFGMNTVGIIGDDCGTNDIDIFVEEDKLKTAIRAITDADYIKCTDQGCPEFGEDRHPHLDWLPENTWEEVETKDNAVSEDYTLHRFHPIAEAHFHIPRGYIVSLYRKPHLLWWLREIPAGAPPPDDPDIVHSTDSARLPQRGLVQWLGHIDEPLSLYSFDQNYGPWSKQYPVKVLSPRAHVEAVILLLCRDLHVERRLDFKWFCMVCSLGREISFRGHVQVAGDANVFAPLFKLRDQLIADGRLPDLPRGNPETGILYRFELTKDCWDRPGEERARADKRRRWIAYKLRLPSEPRLSKPIARPCFETAYL